MRRAQSLSSIMVGSLALGTYVRAAAAATTNISVVGVPTEDMTNVYYGIARGIFDRAGVHVDLVPTSTGAAAVTAALTGTYDMAKTNTLGVFNAHLSDVPLVITAPELLNQPEHPFALLQTAADSPIRTAADLNGKTCACTALNDIGVLATRAWSDKNGGDWRSLKFVEIPNSLGEEALVQHRVDAAILQTPQLDVSLSNGTTRTLGDAWSAIARNFMVGVYVARRSWVMDNMDAVRRFNLAYVQATNYVNTHLSETVSYAAELTKIDPAKMATIRRSFNGTALSPGLIQPIIDQAVKYQVIPRGFAAREILWNG